MLSSICAAVLQTTLYHTRAGAKKVKRFRTTPCIAAYIVSLPEWLRGWT